MIVSYTTSDSDTSVEATLTTMPISCVAPYKATVESAKVSSAPRSPPACRLTFVNPIASPALVVPLVALMRSGRAGTVLAISCIDVWALRGLCHRTQLTWPNDREEALCGSRGYHDKNVLRRRIVDCDEQDVEDDLPNL